MSNPLKQIVHDVRGLYPSERLVLLSFAHDAKARTGNRSRLTAEQLSEITSLSSGSVRRAIRKLTDIGHITREPTTPGGIHITVVHPDASKVGTNQRGMLKPKHKIGGSLRRKVMERDAYRCIRCGGHTDLGCDHIIPESRGGETSFANLQTMCRPCNSAKGARMPDE